MAPKRAREAGVKKASVKKASVKDANREWSEWETEKLLSHRIPYEYDGDHWRKPYKDIERVINRTNQACRLHMLNCSNKRDTVVKRFGKLIEKHLDPYRHLKVRNGSPPDRRSQPSSAAGRMSKDSAPASHQSQAGPSSAITRPMSAKSQKAKDDCHETGDAVRKTSADSFGYANSMQKIAATQKKPPEEADQPHKPDEKPHKSGEIVKGKHDPMSISAILN
ncbi:hypothetical protein Slin15195_G025200 [Septoria linicola]|uniref:Myb-like domain-containing protein n=1 Tax=Septoria linicola TaxID=215465 RepID=A0A9Q9EEW0_9PEZI|nr:hypothetical protein Slin14017_G024290 [Septoria linicola]USW49201.1 hypothetical protein Slin15195_G025200 [Septoria linicola]